MPIIDPSVNDCIDQASVIPLVDLVLLLPSSMSVTDVSADLDSVDDVIVCEAEGMEPIDEDIDYGVLEGAAIGPVCHLSLTRGSPWMWSRWRCWNPLEKSLMDEF